MRSRHHYRAVRNVVAAATISLVVALAGTTSAAMAVEPDLPPIEGATAAGKVVTPLIVSCFASAPGTTTPEPTPGSTGAPGGAVGGVGDGVGDGAGDGAAPARIMLVGDSVTHGAAGEFTYRYRLWQILTAQGVSFDFVGYRDDLGDARPNKPERCAYADPAFDADHAASGGSRFHSLRFSVEDTVTEQRPDVVVVMMGINDLREGHSALSVSRVAERFVNQVRSVSPGTDIVLAHLPQEALYSAVRDYNPRLDQLAARLDTPVSRVVTAKTSAGFGKADMWDHLHPNAVGEVKIARAVHASLAALGYAPGPAPLTPMPAPGPVLSVTNLQATASRGAVALSWGPSPGATGYAIAYRNTTTNGSWITLPTPVASTSTTVRGLAPNDVYTLAVRPVKGTDWAESRVSATVTLAAGDGTVAVPAAPGLPYTRVAGSTITLAWPEVVDHGGSRLTHYVVRQSGPGGTRWHTVAPNQTRILLPNAARGGYSFQVYAANRAGNSASSPTRTATVATRPAAPAGFSARLSGRTATLSWQPPRDTGGAPITGYVVQHNNRYHALPAGARSLKLSNLGRGNHYLRIYASNTLGNSAGTPVQRLTVR